MEESHQVPEKDKQMTTKKGKHFILRKNARELNVLQAKVRKLREQLPKQDHIKGNGFIMKLSS